VSRASSAKSVAGAATRRSTCGGGGDPFHHRESEMKLCYDLPPSHLPPPPSPPAPRPPQLSRPNHDPSPCVRRSGARNGASCGAGGVGARGVGRGEAYNIQTPAL
jgi:hypothetical protein